MFENRTAVLATKHRKEQVIVPILKKGLGLRIEIPRGFDTDLFGTFTREVPRQGTQLEAARQKALAAMEEAGCSIGIASEGSFGPHPAVPFIPGNIELVILIDQEYDLEIVGQALSSETNFNHKEVSSIPDALTFAGQSGFPEHALIVRYQANGKQEIIKGLASKKDLLAALELAFTDSLDGLVSLETDMRAHCNPTRMKTIYQATLDLLGRLKSSCPACRVPGYAIADYLPGLPCAWCNFPTKRTMIVVYRCLKCSFEEEQPSPGPDKANPGECLICNP